VTPAKKFESDIVKHLRFLGGWAYKIPDVGPRSTGSGERFSVPRPFDIVASIKGQSIAIEAKYVSSVDRLDFDSVRPHQRAELSSFYKAGGIAGVLFRFSYPGHRCIVWMDIPGFIVLESFMLQQGKKSVRLCHLGDAIRVYSRMDEFVPSRRAEWILPI